MSRMYGADVAELRALAAEFDTKASTLRTLESQLSWRVHCAPWRGGDVDRFQHDWDTRHRKAVIAVSAAMTAAAQELRANADQQESASAAGDTGRAAPTAPSGSAGQAISGILGILNDAAQLVGRTVNLLDTVVDNVAHTTTKLLKDSRAFITEHAVPVRTLSRLAKFVGGVDLGVDAYEFSVQAENGNTPGMVIEGIDIAFDAVGFLGAPGAAIDTAYDLLSAARDETEWGRQIADVGADIGQTVWDWTADVARTVTDLSVQELKSTMQPPAWLPF